MERFVAMFGLLFTVTLVFAGTCEGQTSKLVSIDNPVNDANSDEVTNLPGLNEQINFKQYSGYLKVDVFDSAPSFLHYWFVESQDSPSTDPVLLWLNGGPGCSSLGGFLTELGPFLLKGETKELELNQYSWNKHANVLFLESPAQVGFSYSPTNETLMHNDDTTAKGNYLALKSFMEKFPQFKKNKLYLSGESYAGVYLPTLGVLVDADPEFNFRGIAIGNGYLDSNRLMDSLVFFAYHHGLVGKTVWEKISEHCCNSQPPARESCTFSSVISEECDKAVNLIGNVVFGTGVNPYGLYNDCEEDSSENRRKSIQRSQDPKARSLDLFSHIFKPTAGIREQNSTSGPMKMRSSTPCVDFHRITRYLNDRDVRTALHIPDNLGKWVDCTTLSYERQYPDLQNGLTPQIKQLINSKRDLTLLVYNGDTDMVCNFLGDEWFVDDLGRKLIKDYAPWKVGRQIGGYYKIYDGIVFATIRGAGHMVPADRPREAAKMIEVFLSAKGHDVQF